MIFRLIEDGVEYGFLYIEEDIQQQVSRQKSFPWSRIRQAVPGTFWAIEILSEAVGLESSQIPYFDWGFKEGGVISSHFDLFGVQYLLEQVSGDLAAEVQRRFFAGVAHGD